MTSLKTYIQFNQNDHFHSFLNDKNNTIVLPKSRAGGEGGVTQEAYKFLGPYLLTPVWEFVLLCHELTMKFQRTIFISRKIHCLFEHIAGSV